MDYAIRINTIDELKFVLAALVDNGYSLGSYTKTVDDWIKKEGLIYKVILIYPTIKHVGANTVSIPDTCEEIFMNQFKALYCKGDDMKTEDIKLPDFTNAQVGDEVYCRIYGEGIIKKNNISLTLDYPIVVKFKNHTNSYTVDGKLYSFSSESTLFYVDGDNKYSFNRSTSFILGSIVPVDTKVLVSDVSYKECKNKRYFSHKKYDNISTFIDGRTSWVEFQTVNWKYGILAESITIDDKTYPKGSRII